MRLPELPLPKLKGPGKVGARASALPATRRVFDYEVRWVRDVELRSGRFDCVCVFPAGKNPATTGLHLTADAAKMLRADLLAAAADAGGSVEVTNHRKVLGVSTASLWQRFVDADAVVLADWIGAATI